MASSSVLAVASAVATNPTNAVRLRESAAITWRRQWLGQFVGSSTFAGARALLLDYSVIFLAASASIIVSRDTTMHPAALLTLRVLCAAVISSRLRGLENLVHEASHGNLFAYAPLNRSLHWLYALPTFKLFDVYRSNHQRHHAFLGQAEGDPDFERYIRLGVTTQLPQQRAWIMFVRPLLGYHHYEWLVDDFIPFWTRPEHRISKSVYWGIVAAVVTYLDGWSTFAWTYLVPFLFMLPVTRWWAEVAEHSALDMNSSVARSRNNVGLMHKYFLNPHYDGYHEIHHLNSRVPFFRLRKAYEQLQVVDTEFAQRRVESFSLWQTYYQWTTNGKLICKAM